jgi:hypothetical protein
MVVPSSSSFPGSSSSSGNRSAATTASQAWAVLKRHARDEIIHLRLQELCRDNDRVSSLVSVYNGGDGGSDGGGNNDRMIMVDLSRQRITLETLNHLLRLAAARNVKKFIRQLAWGPNDPDNPILPERIAKERFHLKQQQQLQQQQQIFFGNYRRGELDADEGAGRGKRNFQQQQYQPFCKITSYHLSLRAPCGQGLEMLAMDGKNVLTDIHRDWERMKRISDSLRLGKLSGITGGMIKDVVVVGRYEKTATEFCDWF